MSGWFDAGPEFRAIDREVRRARRAHRALFAVWLLVIVTIIAWVVTNPGAIGTFLGRIAAAARSVN